MHNCRLGRCGGWHSVRVCGKEIDFALHLPGIGLFVIEVKDWKHANIVSTGPAHFTLRTEQGWYI